MIFIRDKSFYVKSAAIAVPVALQSMITIGVNMMDTIMVSSIGESSLSAVSIANQFITLFQICCMGIGMGASVLTSRFWGQQNKNGLKQTVTIMLRFVLVFACVFAVVTALFPRQIMSIYSKESEIITLGARYFEWSVATYILLGLSLTLTLVLRSVNKARLPLLTSIVSFFVNIGANYIFIFGKLGMPKMGVAGAALGTLISRALELAIIGGYFFFKDKNIGYRIKNLVMPCAALVPEYMRICIPVLISDTLLGLGSNMVAVVMGRIGSGFVAANAVTTVTQQLSTAFTQGISQAGCIVIGHTLGEGSAERAQQEGRTFLALGAIIGLCAGVFIMAISPLVISAYSLTPGTADIAEQLMLAVGFIVIFQSMNSIMTKGVLRGGGDTRFLMVADILFLWAASIPLGALAGLVWRLPAFWIYTFLKIDQVIKAIWCIGRFRSRKWIKKLTAPTS